MNGFDARFSSDVIHFSPNFSTNNHGFTTAKDQQEPSGERDYEKLKNKPQINGITLIGDKSAADLGIDIPFKSISQNGVQKVADENRNVNIEAPEVEMSYTDMLDIWKQWFG